MNRCICFSPVGTSRCIGPRTVPVRSGLSGPQTADFSRPLLTSEALRTGTVRGPFARAATTLNRHQPRWLLLQPQADAKHVLDRPATRRVDYGATTCGVDLKARCALKGTVILEGAASVKRFLKKSVAIPPEKSIVRAL